MVKIFEQDTVGLLQTAARRTGRWTMDSKTWREQLNIALPYYYRQFP